MFPFSLLIIALYCLIPAVIAQTFNPIAELLQEYQVKKQTQKLKHIQ